MTGIASTSSVGLRSSDVQILISLPKKKRYSSNDLMCITTKYLVIRSVGKAVSNGEFKIFLKEDIEFKMPMGVFQFEKSEIASAVYLIYSITRPYFKELLFAMVNHFVPSLKAAGYKMYGPDELEELWLINPHYNLALNQAGFNKSERNSKLWTKQL